MPTVQHSLTHSPPSSVRSAGALPRLEGIDTPLVVEKWKEEHPDTDLTAYLLQGMKEGFRVGCDPHQQLCSAATNMQSASDNPQPVIEYLHNELQEKRILGPFHPSQSQDIHISRFGVIPKRHQPGKWRLILDLSHPPNRSVNDGVAKELYSLT